MEATPKGGEKCNSPTCVIREWLPFCEEELKPKERFEFPKLDECEKFYKSYAYHVGFSIYKWSSKNGKENVQKYNYYVFRIALTNVNPNQKVKLTREGCNAIIGFKRTTNGTFVPFRFHEGRTHLLAIPRKHHMLNSNMGLSHLVTLILAILKLIVL